MTKNQKLRKIEKVCKKELKIQNLKKIKILSKKNIQKGY